MRLANDMIRLRAIEPEDLDWLYRVENDEKLWKWGQSNVPYSRYVLKRYIADSLHDIYADGQLRLVIVAQGHDDQVIGCVDLTDFNPQHLRAEVGILIFPEYQQRGYGKMALDLLVLYAEECLHLHQLYALISVQNIPALKLFKNAGFIQEGVLKDWLCDGKSGYIGVCFYQYLL